MVITLPNLPMLCELSIVYSHPTDSKSVNSQSISDLPRAGNLLRRGFQKLERLTIFGFPELIHALQNEISLQNPPQWLYGFTSLRKLHMGDLPNLVSLPEAGFLSILSELEIKNCNALTSVPDGLKDTNAHLEILRIEGCHSLTSIFRGQLPSSLESFEISDCQKLRFLLDDKDDACTSSPSSSSPSVVQKQKVDITHITLLKYLYVHRCPSLTCLSSTGRLPATLTRLWIEDCSSLPTLSSSDQLPKALESLKIGRCQNLESITDRFHENTSLDYIEVSECDNLEFFPQGLNTLSSLRCFCLSKCPSFVCFPDSGLPSTVLTVSIHYCQNLIALPNCMHSINSLSYLTVSQCPSIVSFPEAGFPASLVSLTVEGLNIYNSLVEWGFHKLTSLTELSLGECADAESFPHEEMGMVLPTTLTQLTIADFPRLKYLSSKSFKSLTSLESLSLNGCPNLTSLPDLPSSLLQIIIKDCPLLKKQCKRNRGREWSHIANNIPLAQIDYTHVYDLKEGEE